MTAIRAGNGTVPRLGRRGCRARPADSGPKTPIVRCAVYTRKSSEEGLQQEFNSLDAQRESGEAYVASMKHEGWVCLPDRYDDGGFTGGNMERPALQRLVADIEAGRIDTVIVYKVDRLSRSLMDFARMMALFERKAVSFVSVTQQFNTTNSMGRLTLNILLSFAQFERELVSERTRDKIAAARRKGKWSGGRPILGYDLINQKLVVNEREAEQVRDIFATYIRLNSLLHTAQELNERGWRTKQWTAKSGSIIGGSEWDKNNVYQLLTNVSYLGKVRHLDNVYPGEQPAIIEESVFARAQTMREFNGLTGGSELRPCYAALLKNVIRCGPCDRAMTHVFAVKNANVKYRYYRCQSSQKSGKKVCPLGSVPAQQLEDFVTKQLFELFKHPEILSRVLLAARRDDDGHLGELKAEEATLGRAVRRLEELHEAVARNATRANVGQRAGTWTHQDDRDLKEAGARLGAVRAEIESIRSGQGVGPSKAEVDAALRDAAGMWATLTPRERTRVVHLLVKTVEYDGARSKIKLTFQTSALSSLPPMGKAAVGEQQEHEHEQHD